MSELENEFKPRDESDNNNGFTRNGHSWYVSAVIPSDLLVKVGDVNFHLHKHPLLSRSGKIRSMIYESCETEMKKIELSDIPGGSGTFELVAKFCYNIAVKLTSANISGLRCAADYLHMTEDLEEGNLISRTEAFLSYVVFPSWRNSVIVLIRCEHLSPWADKLQLVHRCIECVASMASLDSRDINWYAADASSAKWKDNDGSSPRPDKQVCLDWWIEDVSVLRIDHFVSIITAIKMKRMRSELVGGAIMLYARKWLPVIRPGREKGSDSSRSDNRVLVESIITIIPAQKNSVSCSFLLELLGTANSLDLEPALITKLEKCVGNQLEQASLRDLLIPSYNRSETFYDVDLVQRLLGHFLAHEDTDTLNPRQEPLSGNYGLRRGTTTNAKTIVARLVDGYLLVVSKERNLSSTKFQALAEALSESERTCDDGLYTALDSYFKAHPTLSKHEKKRLWRIIDCEKLSMNACMHAVQSERLSLRTALHILFDEHAKMKQAIANGSLAKFHYHSTSTTRETSIESTQLSFNEDGMMTNEEITMLKFEVESVKAKHLQLQDEMDDMVTQFDRFPEQKQSFKWGNGWKKLRNKDAQ